MKNAVQPLSPKEVTKLVHDARKPLNRVSMQTELVKMMLPQSDNQDDILELLDKIILNCQECSDSLQRLSELSNMENPAE
ncbi:histidine kinase [Marinomonas algicola]|jgi:signal transduction histidine kinase|uniref:histidine kinase n=1 Tax=Marinomonas algicola TaxID=2773454 RepID=UPI00174C84D2|nr:histidine kinase [Marinomonas algicola]